jgi:hypothetical protein
MARVIIHEPGPHTHESAAARHVSLERELRLLVLASGAGEQPSAAGSVAMVERITELAPKVAPERVAALAIEARTKTRLRRVSLLLVREMARHKTHRHLVADTLASVIQRPDDLTEFVTIYWENGRVPLSSQVKKGLAAAFPKFDEDQLAEHDRSGPVKLRDVLFLSHAKPRDAAQAGVWKRLIWGRLKSQPKG